MTENTRKALIKILNSNTEAFYATDYDINGGIMNSLSNEILVHKTGNTKEAFIPVGGWEEDMYRKVTIYEWSLNKDEVKYYAKECRAEAMELLAIAELIDSIL